ncbi:MAG TPA: gliding motility-associated ABC transporter ATP-binding subunit GldA [Flavobacteriaceae bacterium]|nr:gliding motility-associated ABC transporter ATP-binding subunit GldA [Flavobacteriaceae bacterium]
MSIEVKNITKKYGNQKAVDDITFTIQSGEVVGFLGPNGAGKSTTMKILTGYIPATSGEAFVNKKSIRTEKLNLQKQIGYLPEHNPLYLEMYVREYLQFCARLHKMPMNRIEEVIKLTGLSAEAHKKIEQLSKGYRQRVGLAAALLHDPDVLILDEPTTGLDPNQLVEIRSLIKKVGKTKTVLLSTHIMQEVEAVCDRVLIIHQGKIVASKKLNELKDENRQVIQVEFDYRIENVALRRMPNLIKIENTTGSFLYELTFDTKEDMRSTVFDFARENGLKILQLSQKLKNLEDLFRELTVEKSVE